LFTHLCHTRLKQPFGRVYVENAKNHAYKAQMKELLGMASRLKPRLDIALYYAQSNAEAKRLADSYTDLLITIAEGQKLIDRDSDLGDRGDHASGPTTQFEYRGMKLRFKTLMGRLLAGSARASYAIQAAKRRWVLHSIFHPFHRVASCVLVASLFRSRQSP
jgi:hypothetical protein